MLRTQGRTLASLCIFFLVLLLPIWYLSSGDHKLLTPSELVVVAPQQIETQLLWLDIDTEKDSHLPIGIRSTRLTKRALTFEDAVAKGCARLGQMSGTVPVPAAGVFNDEDLAGWSQGIEDSEPPDDLQNALTSLGIPFQEDDFQEMSWENDARTTKNGNQYPPSGAEYTNYMNAGSGIIISSNNYGPGSYDVPRNMWPPLWRFSDVTWLQWTRAANANVKNIKYWMRVTIANDDTLSIIAQLFGGDRLNAPQWPGETFLMSEDQGKALLGTPNAAGICWFLAQHVSELGRRLTVSKATVFTSLEEGSGTPLSNILFYIVPST